MTDKKYTIFVADAISPAGVQLLRDEGANVIFEPKCSAEEFDQFVAQADAMIVRSRTNVDEGVLNKADNLRVIGRAGTGVDNIAVAAATKKGVVVMNTPGGNTISAAEHTLGMLLAMMRRIPQADSSMRQGQWEKSKFTGDELYGKTLGIFGLGKIGREVAIRARAFGMQIIAYDPFIGKESAQDLQVQLAEEVDEVLRDADVITLHLSLTEDTRHFFHAETLAKCKKGCKIINCARGELIDEQALHEALVSGQISACALDVFAQEPPAGSPLPALPQVVTTPHLAASTIEAQERVGIDIARQIIDFLQNGVILHAVNFPSLSSQEYQKMSPYIRLAQNTGSFLSQINPVRLAEMQIHYYGELTKLNTKPLSAAAICGAFQVFMKENVNLVNARSLAEERGVKVQEVLSSEVRGYANVLRLQMTGEEQKIEVEATIYPTENGDSYSQLRIVSLDGLPIEAPLSPYMLFLRNEDVPGVIGKLGTILGDADINIANFALGRKSARQKAVAILNLDSPCPKETIQKIGQLAAISFVRAISLAL